VSVLTKTAVRMVRAPALMTLLCKMFFPVYSTLATLAHSNGLSERLFFCISTTVLHLSLYFGMNSMFLYWDRNGIFEKYKLDRTKAMGPSEELIWKTKIEAAVGQALIGPVTLWFIYPLFKYFGCPDYRSQLPPASQLFVYFLFAFVFNDFFFYWAHRTVHSRALYKWIHKQHHEYKGTIGFAAEYASPLEQVFANQLPTIGGCLFSGAHLCVFLVWLAARMEETYEAHSGYCFYGTWLHQIGLTNSEHTAYHDFHHTGNRGNFGGCDWLDHLFGTQDAWLAIGGIEGYIAKKRSENVLNYPSVRKAIQKDANSSKAR